MQDLNILVTRPKETASPLLKYLSSHGLKTTWIPTIEIEQLNPIVADKYNKIIFISIPSVIYGLPLIKTIDSTIFPIGIGTYNTLMKHSPSRKVILPKKPYNSNSLIQTLSDCIKEKILIIKGEGGKTDLQDFLIKNNTVDEANVYKRKRPSISITPFIQRKEAKLIIVTSNEGLDNLISLSLPDSSIFKIPIIVISNRMLNYAKFSGFTNVILAQSASNEDIFSSIKHFRRTISE